MESGELPRERYLTVEFGPGGVAELDPHDGTRLSFVARADVQRISVGSGSLANRPLLQPIAAIALLALGAFLALGGFFGAAVRGNGHFVVGGVALIGLSGWGLRDSFKRGTYVRVEGRGGARKLAVRGRVDAADLQRFLVRMAAVYGYRLESA
jgi:hypothetical protein